MKAESIPMTSNSPLARGKSEHRCPVRPYRAFGAFILLFSGAQLSLAQAPMAPMAQAPAANAADQNRQLAEQVAALRAEVARLQAAVQQAGPGRRVTPKPGMNMAPAPAPGMGMGMMDDKREMGMPPSQSAMPLAAAAPAAMPAGAMGMMDMDDKKEMGMPPAKGGMAAMAPAGKAPMPPGKAPMPMGMMGDKGAMGAMLPPAKPAMPPGGGMGMMGDKGEMAMPAAPAGAMGMCCMGEMGGMPAAAAAMPGGMAPMNAPSSAMPGQPGASHIYHVGSAGFFLNHSQHITLTPDQRLTLNYLKEKAMLDRATEQRKIDQGEQELYVLTGSDQPDTGRIQAKVVEIEALRADQRMSFIRAVSEANNVLTPEQRKALLGTMAPRK